LFGHVCVQADDDEDSVPDIDDLDIGNEEADEVPPSVVTSCCVSSTLVSVY